MNPSIETLLTLLRPINDELPENRANCCYETTLKVAKVLFDNNIPFQVVYSTDCGVYHWFCLSNDLIIDLTASQFNAIWLKQAHRPFTYYPDMLICHYDLMGKGDSKFQHFNIEEVAAMYKGGRSKIKYVKLTGAAQNYIDVI